VAPIIIIIVVVAFIAFIAGLIITVLCLDGTIKDGATCALGVALLIAGLLGSWVAAFTGGQQEAENEPDPSSSDPPG
jgi:hypothetical protein